MDPFEKYIVVKEKLTTAGNILGLNVFKVNYKPGITTYITFACIFFGNLSNIYSIFDSIPDFIAALKALATYGTLIQLTFKATYVVIYNRKVQAITTKVENLYKENSKYERAGVMLSSLRMIEIVNNFLMLLYGGSVFLFLLSPAYYLYFKNEKTLIFAFYFPYIDPTTFNGYLITFIIQILFLIYSLVGLTGFDASFMMYVYHCVSFADTFHIDLKQLMEKYQSTDNTGRGEGFMTLKKVFSNYQTMVKYINDLNQFFATCSMVVLGSAVFSMSILLFVILVTNWTPAYGLLIAMFGQLTINCILGTIIQIQSDKITHDISQFPWYLLTFSEQKDFGFLVLQSQIDLQIKMNMIGGLNVEKLVDILKTVYSYFMMLVNLM